MSTLYFPKYDGSLKKRYYDAYYESVVTSARHIGVNATLMKSSPSVWCGGSINAYSCVLDDKQFIMDFSDLKPFQIRPEQYRCPYFKWQYSLDRRDHVEMPTVFSLTPLQDYKWREFQKVRNQVEYKANGDIITNHK